MYYGYCLIIIDNNSAGESPTRGGSDTERERHDDGIL